LEVNLLQIFTSKDGKNGRKMTIKSTTRGRGWGDIIGGRTDHIDHAEDGLGHEGYITEIFFLEPMKKMWC